MTNLLTIVYGDYHVELFKNACLKSLSQPKNRAALKKEGAYWYVFTDEKHVASVFEAISKAMPPEVIPRVKDIAEARRYIDASLSAFLELAEKCFLSGESMLFAPPDIFFGDGTVNGLLKSGYAKDSVVVVAHVRSVNALLDETKKDVSNPELVSLAWKYLHRCWGDAELGHPRQNQYGTGVLWQRIERDLYQVTHRLPTPYLINFTKDDLDYFKVQAGFGNFDHTWPGEILMLKGRQKYITSSDVAFMVEITEPHKNISNVIPGHSKQDPNDFWAHHFHNEMNKQVLVTMRGEQIHGPS